MLTARAEEAADQIAATQARQTEAAATLEGARTAARAGAVSRAAEREIDSILDSGGLQA